MYCKECGLKNKNNAIFCKDCGAPISKSNNSKNLRRNEFKKVLLILMVIMSATALGISIYNYYRLPKQIENYVSKHKNELKGEKGDRGAMGLSGRNGADGTNAYSPTSCSSWTSSTGRVYTNCY